MTLTIDVPQGVEERLARKARDAGLDVGAYVARVVEAHARRPTLLELSGEVHEQFVASGMSDDELGRFLEQAKHEMRPANPPRARSPRRR